MNIFGHSFVFVEMLMNFTLRSGGSPGGGTLNIQNDVCELEMELSSVQCTALSKEISLLYEIIVNFVFFQIAEELL